MLHEQGRGLGPVSGMQAWLGFAFGVLGRAGRLMWEAGRWSSSAGWQHSGGGWWSLAQQGYGDAFWREGWASPLESTVCSGSRIALELSDSVLSCWDLPGLRGFSSLCCVFLHALLKRSIHEGVNPVLLRCLDFGRHRACGRVFQ